MAEVSFASFGKFAVSAGLLLGMLYLVQRGGSYVSTMTQPTQKPSDVGVPMLGIPGISNNMKDLLQNQSNGPNNSVAPSSDIGNNQGLLFNQQALYQAIYPVLPKYISNVQAMS